MDISIKTIDESRASRVKIVFRADPAGERMVEFSRHNAEVELKPEERDSDLAGSPKWADHHVVTSLSDAPMWGRDTLYTREMVGDLQASEAELVSGPLKTKIADLEKRLKGVEETESTLMDQITSQAAQLLSLKNEQGMYRDRVTELDERLQVRTREVEGLRQSVAARDSLLNKTTGDLRKISRLVFSSAADKSVSESKMDRANEFYLAHVVNRIRNVLGGARGPYSPTD